MARILVIEDEDAIRENIVETLRLNDFEVSSASNGEDGIQVALQYEPHLILCDIMMNGMNGYGVLDAVRRSDSLSLTPFIFLTAKSDRASMRYGMELGADDYIPKPFTTNELLSAINTRLERFVEVEEHANQELRKTKQQLAHVISHELRTPLTSINMSIQLMSQQLDYLSTDDIHNLVNSLGKGTNRLNRLVEQMTLFVEAKSGLLTHEKIRRIARPEALSTVIISAVNHANQFIYRTHNVQVNFNLEDKDVEIACFRQSFIHALAEIIANAISYSSKDGQIEITTKHHNNELEICVADSGNGMTEDEVEKAMQEFQQIDRHIYEQQGIGIGLPLAKMVIQAHGGQLEIQSSKGSGTKAYIYMPTG